MEVVANANIGFASTTTIVLLNYLCDSYGTITPCKMEDATNSMVTPYDNFMTIINLFFQIKKGEKSMMQQTTPSQMYKSLLRNNFWFKKTGPYNEEFKAWYRCPTAENICLNFYIHFAKAYKDIIKYQISAGQAVSNIDNIVMQQETTKALNEMASTVLSDRKTIKHLNSTNSCLVRQIRRLEE